MIFIGKSTYCYDRTPRTLKDIIELEVDNNNYFGSGRLEDLDRKVDNINCILQHVIDLLPDDKKVILADNLGYEVYNEADAL